MGLFFSKEKLINIMELLVQKLLVAFMDRFMNLTFKKNWYPHTQCLEDLTKLTDMYKAQII